MTLKVKVLAPGRKKENRDISGRVCPGMTEMPVRQNLRRSGSPTHRTIRGKYPEQHLRPFRADLQADAFAGYDRLFSAEREGGGALTGSRMLGLTRGAKSTTMYISSTKSATAEEALKLIGELYAIEHEIRGLPWCLNVWRSGKCK